MALSQDEWHWRQWQTNPVLWRRTSDPQECASWPLFQTDSYRWVSLANFEDYIIKAFPPWRTPRWIFCRIIANARQDASSWMIEHAVALIGSKRLLVTSQGWLISRRTAVISIGLCHCIVDLFVCFSDSPRWNHTFLGELLTKRYIFLGEYPSILHTFLGECVFFLQFWQDKSNQRKRHRRWMELPLITLVICHARLC